jgi:iron complex transport system permease protein
MKKKYLIYTICSVIVLLIIMLLSLCIGPSGIPLKKIYDLFFRSVDSTGYSILFQIRLPRIILAAVVGGALSLSGLILQGLLRNPLVEPYTLGISGGAALMVSLSICSGCSKFSPMILPLSGFTGSFIIVMLLYSFSLKKGMIKIHGLLLTGVMFSFISSSLIMLIMSVSKTEDLNEMIFWIMGSLDGANATLIKIMMVVSLTGVIVSYFYCFDLNALLLGED